MFFIFYNIFLHAFALFSIPSLLYRYLIQKRYRESLLLRLGIGYPSLEAASCRYTIWMHAVSVGESKALVPLLKKLRQEKPDAYIIVSNITETGHAEAKKVLTEADAHVYLPFDFPYIIKPIIKQCSPELLILCETDFWINFQNYCKEAGSRLILVNGKISRNSAERLKFFPWFCHQMHASFDALYIQNQVYYDRFEALGFPIHKMKVLGNIKLDAEHPTLSSETKHQMKEKMGIPETAPVITIGSTHNPEERLLMKQMLKVWEKKPNLKVILAPRHPDRCREIKELLYQKKLSFIAYSMIEKKTGKEQVILIDGIGMLRDCYQLSDLSIVAGSYTAKVGGHNILEPSWFGIPVIYGPEMHGQPGFLDLMEESGAGIQLEIDELGTELIHLLEDHSSRKTMGKAGLETIQNNRGATERTWKAMQQFL